jgi:CBS domain-containing protein
MGLLAAKRVLEEMITVRSLLQAKGHAVWTIAPDSSVYQALRVMADKNVGALLVLEGSELVGVVSERDYARKVVLKGRSSVDTPIRDIMTTEVVSVRPDQTVEECMALMTDKRTRHLPVVDDGRLIGVISIGDVVKSIITEQGFMIEQLTSYIVGRQ